MSSPRIPKSPQSSLPTQQNTISTPFAASAGVAADFSAGAAAGFAATISHLRAYVVGAQLGGAATLRSLHERITGFAKDFTACDAATLYLADDRDETALVMRMSTNWAGKG